MQQMTWRNSNYSGADMMSMQQDAVRRVKEMQRIANSRVNSTPTSGLQHETKTISAPISEKKIGSTQRLDIASHPTERSDETANDNPISGLLSRLHLDNDRLIVLVLLIVLLNEGADQKLLLALCYLLL